ncbi:MAG: hypothetical protein JJT94_14245, partial [Bernardetiaceae bacterium]|nr:hypothetical protein [Bernardetiaceae bacterium]
GDGVGYFTQGTSTFGAPMGGESLGTDAGIEVAGIFFTPIKIVKAAKPAGKFATKVPYAHNVGEVLGGGKELFNFTKTTLKHMNNLGRRVPVSILDDAIKSTKGLPDTQGTKALVHYTQMIKNGKLYNLKVLYDKSTNTILHFHYGREAMGPLKNISK